MRLEMEDGQVYDMEAFDVTSIHLVKEIHAPYRFAELSFGGPEIITNDGCRNMVLRMIDCTRVDIKKVEATDNE